MLNSYEIAREALITQGESFLGRPNNAIRVSVRGGSGGIVMEEGSLWQQHRRFCLRVLRDLGFGKNLSQDHIQVHNNYVDDVIDRF